MTVFISMFIFALIGAISPGPVNIIANVAGANYGLRRALPHVLGATVAYTLMVFLVGIGLNEVLTAHPGITRSLQYIGGAFLLYMAYKMATARPLDDTLGIVINPPTFIEGSLSQFLNPKAWLVSMSGVSLFVAHHVPATLYLLVFCLISFWVCLVSVGSWAALGHLIRRFLASKRHQVVFNISTGLLLCGTVVSIFMLG